MLWTRANEKWPLGELADNVQQHRQQSQQSPWKRPLVLTASSLCFYSRADSASTNLSILQAVDSSKPMAK